MTVAIHYWEVLVVLVCTLAVLYTATRGQVTAAVVMVLGALAQWPVLVACGAVAAFASSREFGPGDDDEGGGGGGRERHA